MNASRPRRQNVENEQLYPAIQYREPCSSRPMADIMSYISLAKYAESRHAVTRGKKLRARQLGTERMDVAEAHAA